MGHSWPHRLVDDAIGQVSKMEKALELLKAVDQDEDCPEGLAETAEDLVSADIMNHPVRTFTVGAFVRCVTLLCKSSAIVLYYSCTSASSGVLSVWRSQCNIILALLYRCGSNSMIIRERAGEPRLLP